MCSLLESIVRSGLAISFDVVNAFGTLPWQAIQVTLEYREVPLYLRAVIEAYLRDRTVSLPSLFRKVCCVVPRALSIEILSPLLWNLVCDAVLCTCVPI